MEPKSRRVKMVADITIRVEFDANQHQQLGHWDEPIEVFHSYMADDLKTFLKDHAPLAVYGTPQRIEVVSCEPIEGTSE